MSWSLSLVRTDRGRRIELAREVAAPAAVAWTLLTAVEHWPGWGPPVTDVDYDGSVIEAGTTGRVQAFHLLWVPFRVLAVEGEVDDPGGALWTWTAWGLTPPADGHRVEAAGEDRCRVALELPLWAPWYLPLCALALWTVDRRAAAARDDE